MLGLSPIRTFGGAPIVTLMCRGRVQDATVETQMVDRVFTFILKRSAKSKTRCADACNKPRVYGQACFPLASKDARSTWDTMEEEDRHKVWSVVSLFPSLDTVQYILPYRTAHARQGGRLFSRTQSSPLSRCASSSRTSQLSALYPPLRRWQ